MVMSDKDWMECIFCMVWAHVNYVTGVGIYFICINYNLFWFILFLKDVHFVKNKQRTIYLRIIVFTICLVDVTNILKHEVSCNTAFFLENY